jgi:uncharacterized protein (TIGR02186 family)
MTPYRSSFAVLAAVAAALSAVLVPVPVSAQAPDETRERIEADVSTRSVSITSSYVGTELIVFGTVENSRQPSAEAGYYDVILVVEGGSEPVLVRRRANVGGLWVNTKQVRFASLPSFYAIASSRPIGEIADPDILNAHEIGFEHVRIIDAPSGRLGETSAEEMAEFRDAVVRLKKGESLFLQADYGVIFVGRSLFRATIAVPPNVPVGALKTRIYLLRNGELISEHTGQVMLQRAGLERFLHNAALGHPFAYGIVTVLIALSFGLATAYAFRRG